MKEKINKIKEQIRKECERDKKLKGWFFEVHLLNVEKFAKDILKKFPKADREVVILAVWLHDIQRIRRIPGDHEIKGAREAEKIMKQYGYPVGIIKAVGNIIETHSCEKRIPKSLEGKILSTADAMAFYFNDFVLRIAVKGERDIHEFKDWTMEKLERNYKNKLFFGFAKKKVKRRHDLLKELLTMG